MVDKADKRLTKLTSERGINRRAASNIMAARRPEHRSPQPKPVGDKGRFAFGDQAPPEGCLLTLFHNAADRHEVLRPGATGLVWLTADTDRMAGKPWQHEVAVNERDPTVTRDPDPAIEPASWYRSKRPLPVKRVRYWDDASNDWSRWLAPDGRAFPADAWADLSRRILDDPSVSEDVLVERREAMTWLCDVLGDVHAPILQGWFRSGLNGEAHAVALYRRIRRLDRVDYVPDTIRLHLGSDRPEMFDAGVMVLELASMLQQRGHEVALIRPAAPCSGESRRSQVADVRAILADRPVTLECYRQQNQEEDKIAEQLWLELAAWQTQTGLARLGQLRIRPIADPRPSDLLARLDDVKRLAIEVSGGGGTRAIEGVCEVSFEPGGPALPSPLENGLVIDTFRQLRDSHEVVRLARAADKAPQLGEAGPAVLVLRARALFWHPEVPRDFAGVAEKLREQFDASNVSAVLVYEKWVEGTERNERAMAEGEGYTAIVKHALHAHAVLLVVNPKARWPLTPAEVAALVHVDLDW